ncbi:helix-turn-helix domain-containing protein [Puniceicoccales bacterium CK1056]|uniref:histidine kinase n=1 Tax=Oceanipulchritudo coccoides TaxID=2706888 RepID=A0A6B2LZP9_9BACT|nr:ATP-binding protein [Oceanipulchritudo coccoides]NDV60990.1 helix-turn-helix domain-containing protein [Oceanipulchritudo coccoides]
MFPSAFDPDWLKVFRSSSRILKLLTWLLLLGSHAWAVVDSGPKLEYLAYDKWRWRELKQLSDIQIRSIDESIDGILWIGGGDSLYAYDGYKTRRVPLDVEDEEIRSIAVLDEGHIHYLTKSHWGRIKNGSMEILMSLEAPDVATSELATDDNGNVFLGTSGGLLRFSHNSIEPVEVLFERIDNVTFSSAGEIWLSESNSGRLAVYRTSTDGSANVDLVKLISPSIPIAEYPFKLFPDAKGKVWIVSEDPEVPPVYFTRDYSEVILDDLRGLGGSNVCFGITESHDGSIWISARRFLHRYVNDNWEVLDSEFLDIPTSAPLLYTLNDGSLLISGPREKVVILNLDSGRFSGFKGLHFEGEDRFGGQWFISEDGRVGRNSEDGALWTWFSADDGIPESPSLIFFSSDGTIWVAGSHEMAACVSRFDGETWTRDSFNEMGYRIGHLSAFETSGGDVLFGNGSEHTPPSKWEGGLVRYSPAQGGYTYSRQLPPEVPYRVSCIGEGPDGALFISGPGLNKITDSAVSIVPVPGLERPSWWIDHMAVGTDNTLWLCAWGKGVYRYLAGEWQVYTESDGLLSNRAIYSLPSRFWDGVWVTTQKGIVRFDGTAWTSVFPFPDQMTRESSTLQETDDGELWINIASRAWFFRSTPDPVKSGSYYSIRYVPERNPPVVSLVETPRARVIDGNQYFQWEGFDFWSETPADALEYSYRVNGADWSPFATGNQINLSDLKPGDYTFDVRARDRDWNVSASPASYTFAVVSPLWKRPWFIATMVFTVGLIAFLITLIIRNRVRHILEIEELKIQFFTYLSHELRTPLAVVLGPIESAMKQVENTAVLQNLALARKNANRVLSLVDQLLDFRKFEYSKKTFNPEASDLCVFLRDSVESIRSLSDDKNQRIEYQSSLSPGYFLFDGDMLQKICNNLISNAIKYSPEGSAVTVEAELLSPADPEESPVLMLSVADEGPGITPDDQKLIFAPFYRIKRDSSRGKGAGLGLALVKDLVNAWGGTIAIESPCKGEEGTRFQVSLPVQKEDRQEDLAIQVEEATANDDQGRGQDVVLLVDDDADFRSFVKSELQTQFQVICAKDGAEGVKLAGKHMPGVIVSDFHMPGMSGEGLCRAIKGELETCHIPIILLTSDLSPETELVAVKSFADEFLHKPVSIELLSARLDAVLETRRRLRERFTKQLKIEPAEIAVTSTDEKLLGKAIEVVEKNIQDDTFNVDEFSHQMAMSSRTLYRKLRAITGISPSQFIRSIRLKRAAQFFQGGITNVSDVMVRVGILDASHFSRTFKKEFGKSPRQYVADSEGED